MHSHEIIIKDVRVFDGVGRVREHVTVVIRDDRIAAIEETRSAKKTPAGARTVDGRGLTLLPGLIDCHVHLCLGAEPDVVQTIRDESPAFTLLKAAEYARRTLEAGFTTVRDLGFRDHGIFGLKQAIAAQLMPGPRIMAAGLAVCMTGGHARFIGRQADGPAGIIAAVREQLAAGADVIKFIATGGVLTPGTSPDAPQLTPEELTAGMREAHQAGRRVAAHAHGSEGMKNAILAGAHSIEHGTLMDDEAAGLMRERDVFMVPTLSALATTADAGGLCGVPESAIGKAKTMRARHEASFKRAHRGGIRIALGTDAGTPFNHHGENAQELERMVALGMAPAEALKSATSAAAHLLGIDQLVGTVTIGKLADLVLVDGNPLKKLDVLRDTSKIVAVFQSGRLVAGGLSES